MSVRARETRARRLADKIGLRLVKSRGWPAYSLLITESNGVMYHYREVALEVIEAYLDAA